MERALTLLPETRYARVGDLAIAYQVMGDAPTTLVVVPPTVSHVELFHEFPGYTDFLTRLTRFARVVTFDKRGTGLSDRPDRVALLEERIDDLTAVMDAVESERAVVYGLSEGRPLAVAFAAQYPERVTHLVISGSTAVYMGDPDDGAWGPEDVLAPLMDAVVEHWGEGLFMKTLVPSLSGRAELQQLFGKFERYSGPHHAIRQHFAWIQAIDVRPLLPLVKAPTLVMRQAGEIVPREPCEYMARHIPGARYLEVPGTDHILFAGDFGPVAEAVEEFVTGTRPAAERSDTVLATVLFTDIVGSTEQAARLGDQRWRTVLDAHDRAAFREVERYRGRVVKTTGDGILASFDGPARGIKAARAISDAARPLGIEVRSGLHTGECEIRGDDLAGIAVHIGARVASMAGAGEVLVTSTIRDLVFGAGFTFEDRGEHELKGVPGEWRVLAVAGSGA